MNNSLIPANNYEILDPNGHQIDQARTKSTSIKPFVILGLFVLSIFAGGSAYWSMNAKLDGAVVAPASFVVEGNRKTVQHLEGGIVSELLVKEGDFVEANQVLMRMDGTDNGVNLDILGNQLAELHIRRSRLLSEINELQSFELTDIGSDISVRFDLQNRQNLYLAQKNLFDAQLRARNGEKAILDKRISSLNQEINGLEEQRLASDRQLKIAQSELEAFTTLFKKGLTPVSRVNAAKREIERLYGANASFTTSQARSRNQIGELQLSALGQKKLRKEAITAELATITTQISSLEPQFYGVQQKQKRVAVKAPVSGRIVNMSIYTTGGVIRPGQPILDIVPANERLIVEAKVNTTDIEKLQIGQTTRIRLTAFDQTDVPEATGRIIDLSADSIMDERSGQTYYIARIKLDKSQTAVVENLDFVPGMPADIFVNTGQRTALSYLMQPLNERLARTFIE